MIYILYLLTVVFSRTESTFGKFNGRKSGSPIVFNLAKTFTALVLSLLICAFMGLKLHDTTVWLSAIYGVSMAVSMYAGLMALATGSMAIASVLASFSLIIPVGYGLIFLDERLSVFGIIGLTLLPIAIIMLNLKKGGGEITPLCWFFSILTLIANGICSVIQKEHQTRFPGQYKAEFMVYGMAVAFVLFLIIGLFTRNDGQKERRDVLKSSYNFGLLAGACNCGANFLTLYLAAAENASILFPILSAANAIVACLVGRFVFKEKLTALQIISIGLGIASVVMLKI